MSTEQERAKLRAHPEMATPDDVRDLLHENARLDGELKNEKLVADIVRRSNDGLAKDRTALIAALRAKLEIAMRALEHIESETGDYDATEALAQLKEQP